MNLSFPQHGGQLHAVAARFGLDPTGLLDLSANINPAGPPFAALETMRGALGVGDVLTRYPDLQENSLREALAQYAGVAAEQVMVANGFVPLLDAALRAFSIRSCALPVPCFTEYRRTLEQNSVSITPVLLQHELGFQYQLQALLDTECAAVLLANPQNPTGICCEQAAMLPFIEEAGRRGKYVFLYEAFIDYIP